MRPVSALTSLVVSMASLGAVTTMGACADGHSEAPSGDADDVFIVVDDSSIGDARDDARDASVSFEDATKPLKRRGIVRLDGRSSRDDEGTFVALGATVFWATWAHELDRPRLDAALSENGLHDLRTLDTVGEHGSADFWDGREIDGRWSQHPVVIAGLTDLAVDTYGDDRAGEDPDRSARRGMRPARHPGQGRGRALSELRADAIDPRTGKVLVGAKLESSGGFAPILRRRYR